VFGLLSTLWTRRAATWVPVIGLALLVRGQAVALDHSGTGPVTGALPSILA